MLRVSQDSDNFPINNNYDGDEGVEFDEAGMFNFHYFKIIPHYISYLLIFSDSYEKGVGTKKKIRCMSICNLD